MGDLALILNRTDGTHDSLTNQTNTTLAAAAQLITKQTTKLFQPQAPPVIKQTTPIKPL